jgi:site-specific DNA-methyltransferase (adenine-specific)
MNVNLHLGDCLDILSTLADASVDSVVTDPPAGIGFMGKEWDDFRRSRNTAEVGRDNVFGRTSKRGPEYARRDREAFVAFLGDRMAEARRVSKPGSYALVWALPRTSHWTALALEDAGWTIRDRVSYLFGQGFPKAKSCLKPAQEDWWLAWNPAKRVTPLQIDKCRIVHDDPLESAVRTTDKFGGVAYAKDAYSVGMDGGSVASANPAGRWPANVVHDGSPEVMEAFGSAARFFFCSKATRLDRNEGLEDDAYRWTHDGKGKPVNLATKAANPHPTVKPTPLMCWLCRLITPPGGTVLDCFAGSGSTGKAAVTEGFNFVGIEQDPEYLEIARRRIDEAMGSGVAEVCP